MFIIFILAAILILILWYIAQKKRRSIDENFLVNKKMFVRNFKIEVTILFAIFIFCSILFLLYDENYQEKKNVYSEEIIFLLDVSNSMNVEDEMYINKKISRLEFAKKWINNFIIENEKSQKNFGLNIFTKTTQTIVPITDDTDYLMMMLKNVNSNFFSNQSTNIQQAILFSNDQFVSNRKNNIKQKIIVLTDGEDHYGNLDNIRNEIDKNIQLQIISSDAAAGN